MAGVRALEHKLDARLLALLDGLETSPAEGAMHVDVLASFDGSVARLQALGLQVRAVTESVAVATVSLIDLPRLAGAPEIRFIEYARAVAPIDDS
jgi:hypothetical protein